MQRLRTSIVEIEVPFTALRDVRNGDWIPLQDTHELKVEHTAATGSQYSDTACCVWG